MTGQGDRRNLWASRVKGRVDGADLREINRLLVRLGKLLQQPRRAGRDRLVPLGWVLAPIADQPLRRGRAAARRGRSGAR